MGGRATSPWQFHRNPARNPDSERAHLPISFASWFTSRFVKAEFEIVSVRADPPRAGVNQRILVDSWKHFVDHFILKWIELIWGFSTSEI